MRSGSQDPRHNGAICPDSSMVPGFYGYYIGDASAMRDPV